MSDVLKDLQEKMLRTIIKTKTIQDAKATMDDIIKKDIFFDKYEVKIDVELGKNENFNIVLLVEKDNNGYCFMIDGFNTTMTKNYINEFIASSVKQAKQRIEMVVGV